MNSLLIRNKLVIFFLAVVGFSFSLKAATTDTVTIGQVYSSFQDRYVAAYGHTTTWSSGAPAYPESAWFDANNQTNWVALVQEVADKMADNDFLGHYVFTNDGNIEGASSIPVYNTSIMPHVIVDANYDLPP